MSENAIEKIQTSVLTKLKGLNPNLTYHCANHTLDVVEQSGRIAREEGITNERELFLLKVAALYHDSGFLETYSAHEKKSCEIFLKDTTSYNFTEDEKEIIEGLIM